MIYRAVRDRATLVVMNDIAQRPDEGGGDSAAASPDGRLAAFEARTQTPLDLLALVTLWLVVVPPWYFGHDVVVYGFRFCLSLTYAVDLGIRSARARRHVHYALAHPVALASVVLPPVRVIFSLRLARSMFRRGHLERFLLVALLLVFNGAAIAYLYERHAPGSNIHTLGESVWWALVTVTTVGYGDYTPVTIPGRITACLIMAVGLVAKPFTSLYDGGDLPPELRPAYSIAQAKQKQGKYLEAVEEIRRQLERFPNDFEGHMLLAQIQAEDLKDLPAAEQTIQKLCAQPGHAPTNIAFALYSMADWHLKYTHDRDAARRNFEQVAALLPDTEFALTAAQRIAHLGSAEMDVHRTFTVSAAPRNLGLTREREIKALPEQDPGLAAAELVKHLEKFPLDADAREKLASLYVDHYGRLDLATDQLEQLIQQPHRPGKLIVRWLNMLADLQVRYGADYDTVRETLQRIIDLDPKLAPAETARNRIALLKLEIKAKQEKQGVKMGVYEQNLGLKSQRHENERPPS